MELSMFSPGTAGSNTNTIAATTTSTNRAIPAVAGSDLVLYNDGPAVAFVAFGSSTVTAVGPTLSAAAGTAGDMPIPVGQSLPFSPTGVANAQYWAAISASSAGSNVYLTRGIGN